MFLATLFGWNEGCSQPTHRSTEELVTETLMVELSSHVKRLEKMQRERIMEYHKLKAGVDYSWLITLPRQGYEIAPGEMLELRDICSKIKPAQCGPVILRFRKLVTEYEPEVYELSRIFHSVLQDFIEQEEKDEARRMMDYRFQKQRAKSLAFVGLKSRLKINPFKNEAQTISETEPGLTVARRTRSMPEFNTSEVM
ncbi:protein RD3-like [Protopterus annectens]|uniref:protein RD3-like n=1 Tax=Protopterus annectens TaxID=7888 RepID=UPI001CFA6FB4|nr:protein RD3-like [Protopterus annectens]